MNKMTFRLAWRHASTPASMPGKYYRYKAAKYSAKVNAHTK
ncbi:hypothetical protein O0882_05430 [Janthinobacterium sp. SUN073]|nr:hypothetical protein [Janthinobacterium sp. SUN073]